jgi:integrase
LRNYLRPTDADYTKAAGPDGSEAVQKAVQSDADSVQIQVQHTQAGTRTPPQETTQPLVIQGVVRFLSSRCKTVRESLAERTGFEPADQLPGHGFSKPAHSTTLPPLLKPSIVTTYVVFFRQALLSVYYRLYYSIVKLPPPARPGGSDAACTLCRGGDAVAANSNRKRCSRKPGTDWPAKPYPDFPLSPHPSGAWQKKITVNGHARIHYFGRWGRVVDGKLTRIEGDGWQDALALYKAQADDLHAGRTPRIKKTGEGLKLSDLCNHFLTAKQRKLKAGEIAAQTFNGHRQTTDLLIDTFGKDRLVDDLAADDFGALRDEMAKRWGPVKLGNAITGLKGVFKYGYEAGLIDKPIRYGPEFVKPSASALRRHRAKNGEKMIEADELRRLLDAAPVQLKAMVLLGVNCGFNSKDCADLPLSALDLERGWANFPRPKTGIARRCPLWAETVAALREAIAQRPEPRQDEAAGLVFVGPRGRPWLSRGSANPVSVAARDLMKTVGVHREKIGFATLRHVFRTAADGSRDQVAINYIMGHSDPTMGAVCRERIDDERLRAVSDHVHTWLFAS